MAGVILGGGEEGITCSKESCICSPSLPLSGLSCSERSPACRRGDPDKFGLLPLLHGVGVSLVLSAYEYVCVDHCSCTLAILATPNRAVGWTTEEKQHTAYGNGGPCHVDYKTLEVIVQMLPSSAFPCIRRNATKTKRHMVAKGDFSWTCRWRLLAGETPIVQG